MTAFGIQTSFTFVIQDAQMTKQLQNTVLTLLFRAPEFREAFPKKIIILLIHLANYDVCKLPQNNLRFVKVAVLGPVFTAIQSLS